MSEAERAFVVGELVVPQLCLAQDVLRCARTCRAWRVALESEAVASRWLKQARGGVDSPRATELCVGERHWLVQLRRRAAIETLAKKPLNWRELGSSSSEGGGDFSCYRDVVSVSGYFAVADSEGGLTVWNPSKKYQWNSGKDRSAGRLSFRTYGRDTRGEPKLATVGDDHLCVFTDAAHIDLWKVVGNQTDEGLCGDLRTRFQKMAKLPTYRSPYSMDDESDEEEDDGDSGPAVGSCALTKKAGPGSCRGFSAISNECGGVNYVAVFGPLFRPRHGEPSVSTVHVWKPNPAAQTPDFKAQVEALALKVKAEGNGEENLLAMCELFGAGAMHAPTLLAAHTVRGARLFGCQPLPNSRFVVCRYGDDGTAALQVMGYDDGAVSVLATLPAAAAFRTSTGFTPLLAAQGDLVVTFLEGQRITEEEGEEVKCAVLEPWVLTERKNAHVVDARRLAPITLPSRSVDHLVMSEGLCLASLESGAIFVVDPWTGTILATVPAPWAETARDPMLAGVALSCRYLCVAFCSEPGENELRCLDLFENAGIPAAADGARELQRRAKAGTVGTIINGEDYVKCDDDSDDDGDDEDEHEVEVDEEDEGMDDDDEGDYDEDEEVEVENDADDEGYSEADSEAEEAEEGSEADELGDERHAAPDLPPDGAYAKAEPRPIDDAEYIDSALACATLPDGKEVVIGCEVWDVETHEQLGKLKDAMCPNFCVVQSLLLHAPYRKRNGTIRLELCALPDCSILASVELPSDDPEDHIWSMAAAWRRPEALVVTSAAVYLVKVGDNEIVVDRLFGAGDSDNSGFDAWFPPPPEGGDFSARYGSRCQHPALWHDASDEAFAVLVATFDPKAHIRVVRLDGDKQLIRSLTPHGRRPGRGNRGDNRASICDVAVWRPDPEDRDQDAIVTVGVDGLCVVSRLLDGTQLSKWPATTTNQTPCHRVAVCDTRSVAFTASQCENAGSFWDLRGSNERLARIKPLGTEMRRGKFSIMSTAFTKSGVLAYTSSTDDDSANLHLIAPTAAPP